MDELTEQERRAKTCGSKAQYDNEDDALKGGDRLNELYLQNTIWDSYECPYCGKWHLSKWRL